MQMDIDIQPDTVSIESAEPETSTPVRRSRPRWPQWGIKSSADWELIRSQVDEVELPNGGKVLRWKGMAEAVQHEHEIDAEPERALERDPYWEKLGERG